MFTSSFSSLVQTTALTSRERRVKLRPTVLIATSIACLGALSYGFVIGYASPVAKQLQERFIWSDETSSWFDSVYAFGAMVGSNLGIYTIDKFGRKMTIMLCSVPFVTGWLIIAGVKSSLFLYLGRIVTGLAVGAISLAVPVYIAEISPAKFRGGLVSISQVGVSFGVFMAYSLGPLLDHWRWLAIAGAVPPTLMMVLMTMMPESPRWLIKNDRRPQAMHALQRLMGDSKDEIEEECEDIAKTLGTAEKVSPKVFLKPYIYRPLILCLSLMVFTQFNGTNSIITYASEIVADLGFKNPLLIPIVFATVETVASVISCLVVDVLGRRKLLISFGIVMGVSMAAVGVSFSTSGFPKLLDLLFICSYIVGYSIAWVPVPWLVMPEIFPTSVRGITCGIATQVNWFGLFLVVKTFPDMEDSIGDSGTFFFYAGICLISAVAVFFFLPETKGRTLEEIEELFSGHCDLKPYYKESRSYGATEHIV